MKDFIAKVLLPNRKALLAKLATTQLAPYGLNIRSAFPAPTEVKLAKGVQYTATSANKLFSDLKTTEQTFVAKHFANVFQASILPHALFAQAYLEDGLFVSLQNTNNEVTKITLSGEGIAYIFIVTTPHSQNTVIIEHGEAVPSHTVINFIGQENSSTELLLCEPKSAVPHFSLQHSTLLQQAELKSLQIVQQTNMLQTQVSCDVGKAASVVQNHIVFSQGQDKHDLFSKIKHTDERGQSRMNSKVILHEKAHVIYRGLVDLTAEALQVNSQQKEQTLLLSPEAKIDVVPMLEIINDTISCTHSASISNLNPDQLFYLQARGFSQAAAEKILVQGFYQDIVNQFSLPAQKFLSSLL